MPQEPVFTAESYAPRKKRNDLGALQLGFPLKEESYPSCTDVLTTTLRLVKTISFVE
jgi:hypothetical protein